MAKNILTSGSSCAAIAALIIISSCFSHYEVAAVYSDDENKLLLVLVDGFRWDYIDKYDLVGFKKIRQRGVTVEQLIPVFPSLSFVNYYSIMTGEAYTYEETLLYS